MAPCIGTVALVQWPFWQFGGLFKLGARRSKQTSARLIQFLGTLGFVSTVVLPFGLAKEDPLKQCALRVLAFFYGCKYLDLMFTKASNPPVFVGVASNPATKAESADWHIRYAWRLFSEMRYHSFDIAIHQTQRPKTAAQDSSIAKSAFAMCVLAAIDYLMPLPELKCICLLLLLQVSFESLHSLLHPHCKHPLFYRPFAAASANAFWGTHWHAGATSFLQSLAYRPGKWLGGRMLGVLATFNLTGIWHGWASAALVEDDCALLLGLQVWAFFILQGLLCIVERAIWKDKQGGIIQRVLVWTISITSAGQCFRSLQRHTKISMLSNGPAKSVTQ